MKRIKRFIKGLGFLWRSTQLPIPEHVHLATPNLSAASKSPYVTQAYIDYCEALYNSVRTTQGMGDVQAIREVMEAVISFSNRIPPFGWEAMTSAPLDGRIFLVMTTHGRLEYVHYIGSDKGTDDFGRGNMRVHCLFWHHLTANADKSVIQLAQVSAEHMRSLDRELRSNLAKLSQH